MAIKIISDYIVGFFRHNGYDIVNIIKSEQKLQYQGEKIKVEMYEYFEIIGNGFFVRVCTFCSNIKLDREADITITNDKIGGRGIDEVNLVPNHSGVRTDTCLFYQSMKNPSSYIQAIGRAFRVNKAAVIHMIHNNTTSKNHYKENMDTLKSENMIKSIEPIDL